uniref:Uncharacterized protein n=1 Tax=Panagrolaimus sp. JU765 TaxID=591449 RepID=A0AC34RCJ9_9BILA
MVRGRCASTGSSRSGRRRRQSRKSLPGYTRSPRPLRPIGEGPGGFPEDCVDLMQRKSEKAVAKYRAARFGNNDDDVYPVAELFEQARLSPQYATPGSAPKKPVGRTRLNELFSPPINDRPRYISTPQAPKKPVGRTKLGNEFFSPPSNYPPRYTSTPQAPQKPVPRTKLGRNVPDNEVYRQPFQGAPQKESPRDFVIYEKPLENDDVFADDDSTFAPVVPARKKSERESTTRTPLNELSSSPIDYRRRYISTPQAPKKPVGRKFLGRNVPDNEVYRQPLGAPQKERPRDFVIYEKPLENDDVFADELVAIQWS